MVGVYFKGRLGNQLFQYVYLLYLKEKHKDKTFFFPNPHHAYLTKYFDLGFYHNLTLGSKLYSGLTRVIPDIIKFEPFYVENLFHPKERDFKDWTMHYGYYQTDWYLKQLSGGINIKIKDKWKKQFQEAYGNIFNNYKTIVVHIRRTDYLNFQKRDISLPGEYFVERLKQIKDIDSYKVFFVSDDLDYVKKFFPAKPNYIFSNNNEITDFQIIQNADIAIISNSTFAWWAAYLSPKKNIVYAPKNWMAFRIGAEYPRGVMTDKFIWCDVLEDIKSYSA